MKKRANEEEVKLFSLAETLASGSMFEDDDPSDNCGWGTNMIPNPEISFLDVLAENIDEARRVTIKVTPTVDKKEKLVFRAEKMGNEILVDTHESFHGWEESFLKYKR